MKSYLFLFVLITITKLYSQVFSLYSTSSINDIYSASSFSPSKIRIAQNGVILLDTENSILVHFSENDTISYGGKSARFSGLIDPVDMIQRRAQTFDYLIGGLLRGLNQKLSSQTVRLSELAGRLQAPKVKIAEVKGRLLQLAQRFDHQLDIDLSQRMQKLDNLAKLLDANSFERVLDRGFALVIDKDGVPIKHASKAPPNAAVTIQFSDGLRDAILGIDKTSSKIVKKRSKQVQDDGQDKLF